MIEREGKKLHRYRAKDYRIYFERSPEGVTVHRVLHKNTLRDFLFRSKLPMAEDDQLGKDAGILEVDRAGRADPQSLIGAGWSGKLDMGSHQPKGSRNQERCSDEPRGCREVVPADLNRIERKYNENTHSRLRASRMHAAADGIVCAATFVAAAKSSPASKRTDVYHVFVVKAALGKAKELQDWLKEPDPDHPDRKGILLRHQDGDSWDYVAIEHIGAKATVEIGGTPMTPQQRTLDGMA